MMRELAASRDLASTIERSKHELHEKIMTLTVEYEELQKEIHRLTAEKETLMDQLKSEVL